MILGRAWLDDDAPYPAVRTSPPPNQLFGTVREVLLVSPAAGRVLVSAQEMAGLLRLVSALGYGVSGPGRALVAAVDALVGDRPEASDGATRWEHAECGHVQTFDPHPDPRTPGSGPSAGCRCEGCGHPTGLDEWEPVGDRPAEQGHGCGKSHCGTCAPAPVAAGLTEPTPELEPSDAGFKQPGGNLNPEPVPVPVSDGPGFDRSAVDALLARSGADATDHELRQVVALLADRDRRESDVVRVTYERDAARRQRDAARAEVERLRAEVDTAWEAAGDMAAKEEAAARVTAERDRLRADVERYRPLWSDPRARPERWISEPNPHPRPYISTHEVLEDYDGAIRCSSAWSTEQRHAALDRTLHHVRPLVYEIEHLREELVSVRRELERLRGDGVDPAAIVEQREKGWTDFHAERYCHRCGRPNIWSWFTENALWNAAEGDDSGILCPVCFVADYERATGQQERITWRVVPENAGELSFARNQLHAANERLAAVWREAAGLRAELEQARRDHPAVDLDRLTRDAAADTLAELAASLRKGIGEATAPTADVMRSVASVAEYRAAEIRDGRRPVPARTGEPTPEASSEENDHA